MFPLSCIFGCPLAELRASAAPGFRRGQVHLPSPRVSHRRNTKDRKDVFAHLVLLTFTTLGWRTEAYPSQPLQRSTLGVVSLAPGDAGKAWALLSGTTTIYAGSMAPVFR